MRVDFNTCPDAVDRDIGVAHEGRLVRRKVADQTGHFFRLAQAAYRTLRTILVSGASLRISITILVAM